MSKVGGGFKCGAILFATLGASLWSAAANAQNLTPVQVAPAPSAPAPLPPAAADSGYGGQILLADIGTVAGSAVLAIVTKSGTPLVVGAIGWSLASPVVHAFHGHPGKSAVSLLLHVGLPVLGLFVGAATANCPRNPEEDDDVFCGVGNILLGGALGMIAATVVDAGFLAGIPDEPSHVVAIAGHGASAPAVSIGRNGDFSFGWRGTF